MGTFIELTAADGHKLRAYRAEAAGKPIKIDAEHAKLTSQQIGNRLAGWFQFQPLYARIVKEQPDLLE